MSGEIVLDCGIWSHRTTNPNGIWTHLPRSGDEFAAAGWLLPSDAIVDLLAAPKVPLPSRIAATPAGKVRARWQTDSPDTVGVFRLQLWIRDLAPNAAPPDPGVWDDVLNLDMTSGGAGWPNEGEIAIVSSTLVAGRRVQILARRTKPSGSDTLSADVVLEGIELVADEAT